MEIVAFILFLAVICILLFGYPVAFTLAGVSLMFAFAGVLSGTFDPALLQAFLVKHQLSKTAWRYQSSYKGSPWYVVIYGDYETIEKSREAISQLPKGLQDLSPWSKSFAAVHKDIKSVEMDNK